MASPISRTEGGQCFSFTQVLMKSSICFWRFVRSDVVIVSPRESFCPVYSETCK